MPMLHILFVWGKVNFNCDLKFSGPRCRYLVVRNRINIAMNDRMETGRCFLRSISIEKYFLKEAKKFVFISQHCNPWMQFKVFNEDGYFHANSREKKVKRFNWINFETWCFEPKRRYILWLIVYFVIEGSKLKNDILWTVE